MIGIRPGEKLHEVMISEDDSRMTIELDDRFVIAPILSGWSPAHLHQMGGRPVAEGFRYSSETNTELLTNKDEVAALLAQKPA